MTGFTRPTPIAPNTLLVETVTRLLSERCPPEVASAIEATGAYDRQLWKYLTDAGITLIGSSDDSSAGGIIDAIAVLRACGERAVPAPIAEHGPLAAWLVRRAGIELPKGVLSVPVPHPSDRLDISDGRVIAQFNSVPFAGSATHLVAAVENLGSEHVVIADKNQLRIEPSRNIAGEPRDFVAFESTIAGELPIGTIGTLSRRGILSRVALMTGAMRRALQLAAHYAHDRRQFNRPIISFQAVQHLLALAAEHVVNTEAACSVAGEALASDEMDPFHRVDIARVIAHQAMEVVSRHCHQVFGAVGVTKEHELHLHTRRLWAWDLEWGTPELASTAITTCLASSSSGNLWAAITGLGLLNQ